MYNYSILRPAYYLKLGPILKVRNANRVLTNSIKCSLIVLHLYITLISTHYQCDLPVDTIRSQTGI